MTEVVRRAPRVISSDSLGQCKSWELPDVFGNGTVQSGVDEHSTPRPPTAKEVEAIHRQAYENGFDLGKQEGREIAYKEMRSQLEESGRSLQQIFSFLDRPLQQLDDDVERSLVELTILIARHLIRRELKTSPEEIVAVVRETVKLLPVGSRKPTVYLHPDDLILVKDFLGLGGDERTWRLESDPTLNRGGCMVETESSYIDATVEKRLSAIVSALLGGERESDPSRPQ